MIVHDNEGARIVAKFYSSADFPTALSELEFEKKLVKKTKDAPHRADAEVVMLDGFTVVYRNAADVTFAVVGPGEENDLMLVGVLDALFDTMGLLLKGVVDKRSVLAQLELLLLALDELIEGGVPFELDAPAIEARVMLRGAVPDTISSYNEMTIGAVADKLGEKIKKQCVDTTRENHEKIATVLCTFAATNTHAMIYPLCHDLFSLTINHALSSLTPFPLPFTDLLNNDVFHRAK